MLDSFHHKFSKCVHGVADIVHRYNESKLFIACSWKRYRLLLSSWFSCCMVFITQV